LARRCQISGGVVASNFEFQELRGWAGASPSLEHAILVRSLQGTHCAFVCTFVALRAVSVVFLNSFVIVSDYMVKEDFRSDSARGLVIDEAINKALMSGGLEEENRQ
jgi:hypothetical protein